MKKHLITALAGLMVSCGQNSVETATPTQDTAPSPAETIISVTRSGDPEGQTIILIPGLASSADVWTDTAASLDAFDVHKVQVTGFADDKAFTVEGSFTDAITASVNDYLLAHPGKETALIGHSMGGFIALKAALADESNIEEVIIVDSLPFLAEMFMPGASPEQAAMSAPMMAAQMAKMPRAAFDGQQSAGLPRLAKTSDFHSTLETWAKASDQFTVASVMGEMLAADLRSDLSNIQAQITVVAAYDTAMGIPKSQLKSIYSAQYALAPNHNIQVIEDSFHFIMVDQKDAFISVLEDALKD